jgi:hypothetical protein
MACANRQSLQVRIRQKEKKKKKMSYTEVHLRIELLRNRVHVLTEATGVFKATCDSPKLKKKFDLVTQINSESLREFGEDVRFVSKRRINQRNSSPLNILNN